jgi:Fe-S oxidoreductase
MLDGFHRFKEEIIEKCVECGFCFEKCYAYKKTKYPIWLHLKDFFKDQKDAKNIKRFINSCIYCKYHEYSCPNGLILTEMLPTLRNDLSQIYPGFGWAPGIVPNFIGGIMKSRRLYSWWRYMNNLLISEDYREKWDHRREPKKREVLFFSGCGIQLLPDIYYTMLEVLEKLDIDFGLIDGHYNKAICCGTVMFLLGNYKYGKKVLTNLIKEIEKFGTKKVIIHCSTCNWGLNQIAPNILKDFDLEIIHASTYIAELLEKNPELKKMLKPLNEKKVYAIHDSCHLVRGGDTEGARKLFKQLPEASIAEMKHNKLNAICDVYCILRSLPHRPLDLMLKKDNIPISKEALDSNADVLTSLCLGCHAIQSLLGQSIFNTFGRKKRRIPLKNWTIILGKYLGLPKRRGIEYWLKHFITRPFKDSLLHWILKAIKALIFGYLLNKIPPIRIPKYLATNKNIGEKNE